MFVELLQQPYADCKGKLCKILDRWMPSESKECIGSSASTRKSFQLQRASHDCNSGVARRSFRKCAHELLGGPRTNDSPAAVVEFDSPCGSLLLGFTIGKTSASRCVAREGKSHNPPVVSLAQTSGRREEETHTNQTVISSNYMHGVVARC